jgi:prepilin-type N-terminal cleavage/methylation domain-containing protein
MCKKFKICLRFALDMVDMSTYIAGKLNKGVDFMYLNRKTAGFTLMEIMVVIIVIAVLASVAGPMIGSITNQGRASATKSKANSLKSAIMAYKSDVGRYPFYGPPACVKYAAAYNKCSNEFMDLTEDKNIFVNEYVGNGANEIEITNYNRKWKGPYMESTPDDFMMDAWGEKIHYVAYEKNVYLWSAGADMVYEAVNDVTNQAYVADEGIDDIVMSVARVRQSFNDAVTFLVVP